MNISSGATDDRAALADRIRRARRGAKLSKTALAKRLGITPSAVSQWEHPRGTRPGLTRLGAVARITGVAFEWLAVGRGSKNFGPRGLEETSTLKLDFFAQDEAEELLLQHFRKLPPRARLLVVSLIEEAHL